MNQSSSSPRYRKPAALLHSPKRRLRQWVRWQRLATPMIQLRSRPYLTSAGEARQNGYQAFRPVTEANIRNDTHDSKVLNDIAVKSNNVMKASLALDQDP